jgi:hypothetical protein
MAAEISYYHHEEVNKLNEIYQYFKQGKHELPK